MSRDGPNLRTQDARELGDGTTPCCQVSQRSVALLLIALLTSATPVESYADHVRWVASRREALSSQLTHARGRAERVAVIEAARREVLEAFDRRLFPAWLGTQWAFHGTSETPGSGTIACGYFVSTLLRDAGFRVQRVRMAQQASEQIVTSLAPEAEVVRFRYLTPPQVVARVRERFGDGLFVVGLDYHVAFLRLDGAEARLCHSAVLAPGSVVCEPAATAEGLVSGYHVVGRLLSEPLMLDWLQQRDIPTRMTPVR